MKARPSIEKRRKEIARQEKKQRKAERREQRKAERADKSDTAPAGVDPDLVGIVAGPQPPPVEAQLPEDAATGAEEK